ncbi:MAG: tetratricopeptide repeat protein [Spirochaetales bacterium]|nr:MAG: tetratricopeptide repeat protein [Spirochaetales bacterium]
MRLNSPRFKTSDDPYLKKRRRKRLALAGLLSAIVAAVAFGVPAVVRAAGHDRNSRQVIPRKADILALWERHDYKAVVSACDLLLGQSPLDSFCLSLRGMSLFYLGIAELDSDKRVVFFDDAVFSLRKALIADEVPLRNQNHYVLGKTYFQKGIDYYEEAISELEKSIVNGPVTPDAWEYLALAAQGLSLNEKSVEYFEKALQAFPDSAELKAAAARSYVLLGGVADAERLALEAYQTSTDAYLTERCAFLLGEIYRSQGRYDEALASYQTIKDKNPESADAWYYEGLVFMETGDPLKARASWRKAVSIDPMHTAARQKLSERS